MIEHTRNTSFENISQRAAYPYVSLLIPFSSQQFSGGSNDHAGLETSARDFHTFLESLFETLYRSPSQFGLPVTEDFSIVGDEPDLKKHKAVVRRKLDNPRKSIQAGMDFLLLVALRGELQDGSILVERNTYDGLVKESKIKKKFLAGLEMFGLTISASKDNIQITGRNQPMMMKALKALAEAGGKNGDVRIEKFHFARADFRNLDGDFAPEALDLYASLDSLDLDRLSRLHEFFLDLGYKTIIRIDHIHAWDVQYQGPNRIKSSPFLRIEYDPRCQVPLQAAVKLASTNRIVDLVYLQPRFLQEDFARRVNDCGGCGWCNNSKGLGATVFNFDGQRRTICWHHKSEIPELDETALEIIQQYALMHEALA